MAEKETKKGITRRGFIKGAAAGVGAAALAKVGIKEAGAVLPPEKWDKKADILVVGGGAAGLTAAVKAHDAGASVILIEKASTFYVSSSAICGGTFSASNSKVHRKMGIDYPPDKFYEDLMKWGKHTNIPELARAYAENSGKVIDWLVDLGLNADKIVVPRVFFKPRGGKTLIDLMVRTFKSKNISSLLETKVSRLILDPATERVLGVEAEKDEKKIHIKAQKATVIATGGFAGNFELYDKILLEMRGGYSMCSPYASGDGLLMGHKIGADVTHLSYCAPYACGLQVNQGRRQPLTTTPLHFYGVGGFYINKEGVRFCDEAQPLSFVGLNYLPEQPDKYHYYIFDHVMWKQWLDTELLRVSSHLTRDIESKEEKLIKTANTIESLGKNIGIDPITLKKTTAKFNSYVDAGDDKEFKRKKAMKLKVETPPFYAMGPMRNNVALCLGGLRSNGRAQVLDPYGTIIPGLYCAGEVMGGVHGSRYHGGTAFGKAFTFGYIAGKNASMEKALI